MYQKSVISVTIGIFKGFKSQIYVYNGCLNISIMSMKSNDIVIFNNRGVDCCINNGISKSKALNLLQNAHLSTKWWSL